MNGSFSSTITGQVEVCVNNVYGAICNSRWDERDAGVVCRQMGRGECAIFVTDILVVSSNTCFVQEMAVQLQFKMV